MNTDFINFPINHARLCGYGDVAYSRGNKPAEITEHYKVRLSTPESVASTKTVEGLPEYGAKCSLSGFKHLKVTDITFSKVDNFSVFWDITVKYGERSSQSHLLDSDTSRYVSVSWSVDEVTSDFCYDLENNPVVNSAGDPYDTLPTKTEFVNHITIVRREKSLPDMSLNGTINDSDVKILGIDFARHCARLKMSVNLVKDENQYETTYEIIGMKNWAAKDGYDTGTFIDWGWDLPMVECGYQYYDDNGQLCKFTVKDADGNDRDVSTPQLLDFNGKDARGSNPHVKRYQLYSESNWTTLKFPTNSDEIEIKE